MAGWAPGAGDLEHGKAQSYNLTVVGRLKDEASIAQAQADLDPIMSRVKAQFAEVLGDRVARVVSFQDSSSGPRSRGC